MIVIIIISIAIRKVRYWQETPKVSPIFFYANDLGNVAKIDFILFFLGYFDNILITL